MSKDPSEQTSFQPVEIEEIDGKLGQLASDKNIPTLVPSAPTQSVEVRKLRSPGKPLTIDVPDYLRIALKVDAAQQGVSVRYMVLTALVEQGYDVEAEDLIEDGRRHR